MHLDVSVDREGDVAVVAAEGEIDLHTADQFKDGLTGVIADGARRVVVDLSGVDFMDSTGLSVIVQGVSEIGSVGGDLRVVTTADKITKIFTLTGLDQHLSMFPTLAEARSGW